MGEHGTKRERERERERERVGEGWGGGERYGEIRNLNTQPKTYIERSVCVYQCGFIRITR